MNYSVKTMGYFHRAPSSGHRAFRLLLLLLLAITAIQCLIGAILYTSLSRSYSCSPMHNVTTTIKTDKKIWLKKLVPSGIDLVKNSTNVANRSNNNSIKETLNMMKHNVFEEASTPLLITKIMEGIRIVLITKKEFIDDPTLPPCDEVPPGLGPISVNKTKKELDWVEKHYPEVSSGGMYASPNCTARHRVAIIVPYRNRQHHLPIFLNHMHPFLMKQQIQYGIYIIEQEGTSEFNRGKLMNVGFAESQRQRSWQCFIFHDIDMLPMDSRNMYTCPTQPRHMAASLDRYYFRLQYLNYYGGVAAMTLEQYTKVNGFSNKYWGWGGEDDDIFYRIKRNKYRVQRYNNSINRYANLYHKKSAPNPKRFQLLAQMSKTYLKDGLSTLEYELIKVTPHHLYTHILVNIDERR